MGDAENVYKVIVGSQNATLPYGTKRHFQTEVNLKDIMTLDNIEKVSCECCYVSPIVLLNGRPVPLEVEITTLAQHANYDARFRTMTQTVAIMEPTELEGINAVVPNVGDEYDNNTFAIVVVSGANTKFHTIELRQGRYDTIRELVDEINSELKREGPAGGDAPPPPYLTCEVASATKLRIIADPTDTRLFGFNFSANSAYIEMGFNKEVDIAPRDIRATGQPLISVNDIMLGQPMSTYSFKQMLGKVNLNKEHLNSHIWDVKVRYLDGDTNLNVWGEWVAVVNFGF